MKKNLIWKSDIDLKDWEGYFKEEYPDEELSENEKYERVSELNNMYLDDERCNLDIDVSNGIVIIGDIGTWQGRRAGIYKEALHNIKDCLYSMVNGISDIEFYCDRYNFRATERHHDGTNYYLYREWKDNVSEWTKERFINEGMSKNQIAKYTRSLRPYISKVYGWK